MVFLEIPARAASSLCDHSLQFEAHESLKLDWALWLILDGGCAE